MNTRQKLTIGIAAIFMVTLTIVGVTYAYFVTRVTGDETPVDVQTATLGEVVYLAGNKNGDVADQITLTGVEPNTSIYKTFSVANTGEAGLDDSNYAITVTNAPGTVAFIHSATGSDEDDANVKTKCYNYDENATNISTNAEYTAPEEFTADAATCYVADGKYNNIEITLWSVEKSVYDTYNTTLGTADPQGTVVELNSNKLTFNTTDTITKNIIPITPGYDIDAATGVTGSIHYYVLKVKYTDNGMNQNAENLAELDLRVSIKAA